MPTTQTAASRRAILANAHAKWIATSKNSAIDAVHNLKQSLVQVDQIELTNTITDVRMDGTTICITVDCDDFVELMELDAYGNIISGNND